MASDLRALTNLARAASTGAGDVAALTSRLCASLAASFDCADVEALRYLPETGQVVRVTSEPHAVEPLATQPLLVEALADAAATSRGLELAVPLLAADRLLGFLRTTCRQEPRPEQLELWSAAGAFVAAMLQRALDVEETERLSRLKSQFIALASHELRAPAAVVHGVAETIVAQAERIDSEQLAALHEALAQQTGRLSRLLDELLDLSRLEAKAIEIRREPLVVRERVEELVRAVAGERAHEILIEVEDDVRPLVDAAAFDRILGNLVTNALRHGRTPISIRAVQNDRHFRVSVEDQGDGVSPGFVPRLFDRFARAAPEGAEGSGLGLSIAQAYAQAHGGQLFYEDASPRGARFQLVLPAH